MKTEYLLVNALIISGPLILSFDRRVHFISYIREVLLAIILSMIPFIIWDALAAGRHWWFNPSFTLDARIAGLPVEEWLFFISVPYACLFTWQVINVYISDKHILMPRSIQVISIILFIFIAVIMFLRGTEYTGITFMAVASVLLLEMNLKIKLLGRSNSYLMLAFSFVMMLIFNGYLTARPIVQYDPKYQLNWLIYTIPVEDFLYGITLILLNIVLFEKFKARFHG